MAYTALELINRAYYLSQVVSRELQTVSGVQVTDGLYLLNALIGFKNTDVHHIPYYTRYSFNSVIGQEEYFIDNLLEVDSLTFNIGDVRYSLDVMTRDQYFGSPRVDNIESLPYMYRVEREIGGSRIYLYFEPQAVYVMKLSGKFGFDTVDLTTDLETVFDSFYIEYMRYLLASMICAEYGATFPDASQQQLGVYQKKLMSVSPKDLSLKKRNLIGTGTPAWNWQAINLVKGFWPD